MVNGVVYGSDGLDLHHGPEKVFDEDDTTEFVSECAPCARHTIELGIVFPFPVDVHCIKIMQDPSRRTACRMRSIRNPNYGTSVRGKGTFTRKCMFKVPEARNSIENTFR